MSVSKLLARHEQMNRSTLLKINRLGLPKCLTMDSHLAQAFAKSIRTSAKDTPLKGGTTTHPLSEVEVRHLKERKEFARAQRKLQETIARIRAEHKK